MLLRLVILGLLVGTLSAQTIYTDRVAFEAAVGAVEIDRFDSYPQQQWFRIDAAFSAVTGLADYDPLTWDLITLPGWPGDAYVCSGCNGGMSMTPSYGDALGFDYWSNNVTINGAVYPDQGFFGIVGSTAPVLIELIPGVVPPAPLGVQIDNVTVRARQLCPLCGDCDYTGAITILDALHAAQAASGLVVGEPCCDVNNSGSYTILDSLLIAQHVVGLQVMLVCP